MFFDWHRPVENPGEMLYFCRFFVIQSESHQNAWKFGALFNICNVNKQWAKCLQKGKLPESFHWWGPRWSSKRSFTLHSTTWRGCQPEKILSNSVAVKALNNAFLVVRRPTNAPFIKLEKFKIYTKIHINIAPMFFGLWPSSGSMYCTWLKLDLC